MIARPKIKICGITRLKDARLSVSLGADYLGFIFYRKSKRYISPDDACKIAYSVNPLVSIVAVFVDETPEHMLKISRKIRANVIQLHGNQSERVVRKLQSEGMKVALAFGVSSKTDWKRVYATSADFVLLDNSAENEKGGTGKVFDWGLVPRRKIRNLFLAGGLEAGNYGRAIKKFSPLILDFNSGVEVRPGLKSSVKLKYLFKSLAETL
ncbi:MAG: phosphoribosylanthranilate isomerase [candidate division Zixibacteria bacterium]|nr:phosphoribosylanthranilate isomerase [candidate division Zixibacteria bacterium]